MGVDTTPPDGGQYSILHLIDAFKDPSRDFQFRIDWPKDGDSFVQWEQPKNPFDLPRGTVSNIVQSPTDQFGCTPFGGLAAEGNVFTTMDGDAGVCQWWAIGTSAPAGAGGGIPGFSGSDVTSLIATRTRLWVR
jgi:hypothetical protein